MPLIRDGRFVSDEWTRPAPEGGEITPTPGARLLIPFAVLTEQGEILLEKVGALGVELSNDVDPNAIEPWFGRLQLVSVLFPKSADGRGFSMATRLRRLGFSGELRATGHIIADQYGLAISCGFDTVEITEAQAERQPEPHWIEAQRATSLAYQRGYGQLQNILSARWTSN